MERPDGKQPDQVRSMDFVADSLFNGRRIRALTIVDNFGRECLAIAVGQSLKGTDVVEILTRIHDLDDRCSESIQVDNGSEFISKEMDHGPMRTRPYWTSRGRVNPRITPT